LKQANSDNKALSYEKSNDASSSDSEYRPPAISIDADNDKEVKNMNLRLT
jgi:hypothetical protein